MEISSPLIAGWGLLDVALVFATVSALIFMLRVADKKWQDHQAGIKLPPKVSGGWPWLGHAHEFAYHPREFLQRCRKKYGDVFRFTSHGFEVTIVCGQNDLVPRFFKGGEKSLNFLAALKFVGIDVANNIDIEGLKTPKSQTMNMTKHNFGVIRSKFIPQFRKYASQFQPEIEFTTKKRLPGTEGVFDSTLISRGLVGRMSLRVSGGRECARNETLMENMYEYTGAADAIRTQWFSRRLSSTRKKFENLKEVAISELMKVLAQRREWQKEDPDNWMQKHNLNDYFSYNIDALTYEDGKRLFNLSELETDHIVCTRARGIMFAAMGNTTHAVELCMLNVIANRKAYDAACEEVERVCAKLGPDSRFDQGVLAELEFLEACFYEGTRMGVFPMNLRELMSPFELKGGYKLPAGSYLGVSPLTIHQDSNVYPEPQEFNPWRMMGDEGAALRAERSWSYLTFGAGRHECLGRPMAETEFKLTMAELLRKYELEVVRGDDGLLVPESVYAVNSFPHRKRPSQIKYKLRATPLGSAKA